MSILVCGGIDAFVVYGFEAGVGSAHKQCDAIQYNLLVALMIVLAAPIYGCVICMKFANFAKGSEAFSGVSSLWR